MKLKPLPPAKIIKVLKANGFVFIRQNATSHAVYKNFNTGKKCEVPMHKYVTKNVIMWIVRETGISKEEFLSA